MNNFVELQLLPKMKFSFNNFRHQTLIVSLLKSVSDFTADGFTSEKELFIWTYLLKKALRRTKILLFPVWNKILKIWDTLFEIIQIEAQCSKVYFKFFSSREAGASGNHIEKEPQKPRQKLKKYVYIKHLQIIFALPAIQCKW